MALENRKQTGIFKSARRIISSVSNTTADIFDEVGTIVIEELSNTRVVNARENLIERGLNLAESIEDIEESLKTAKGHKKKILDQLLAQLVVQI